MTESARPCSGFSRRRLPVSSCLPDTERRPPSQPGHACKDPTSGRRRGHGDFTAGRHPSGAMLGAAWGARLPVSGQESAAGSTAQGWVAHAAAAKSSALAALYAKAVLRERTERGYRRGEAPSRNSLPNTRSAEKAPRSPRGWVSETYRRVWRRHLFSGSCARTSSHIGNAETHLARLPRGLRKRCPPSREAPGARAPAPVRPSSALGHAAAAAAGPPARPGTARDADAPPHGG